MSNNDNIDRLFRDRLETQNFSPSHEDWQAMSKLLDEKKEKKKGILPFVWMGIGFIIALALGFSLSNREDNSVFEKSGRPSLQYDNSDLLPNDNPFENLKQNQSGFDKSQVMSGQDVGKNLKIYSNIIDKVEKGLDGAEGRNHVINHKVSVDTEDKNEIDLVENRSSFKVKDKSMSFEVGQTQELDNTNVNMPTVTKKEVANNHEIINDNLGRESLYIRPHINIDKIASLNSHIAFETPFSLNLPNPIIKTKEAFQPYFTLGLGGEVVVGSSAISGAKIGILGDYVLGPKLILNVGINYDQQSLNIYNRVRLDQNYGFGNSFDIYGIQAKRISSMSLPIGFHYKNGNNQFGVGYEARLLMGVYGEVQEINLKETKVRSSVENIVETLNNGWVEMGGFNTNNGRLYGSYRRQLGKSLFMGMKGYYQTNQLLTQQPPSLKIQKSEKLFLGLNIQMYIK